MPQQTHKTNTFDSTQQKIIAGDHKTLEQLYQSNFERSVGHIRNNSGTIHDAEDIYQECFLKIWRKVKKREITIESEAQFRSYLHTMVKNKWIDKNRSLTHKMSRETSEFESNLSIESNSIDEAEYESQIELLKNGFRRLGQPCKELLQKFYYEKRSLKDIASQLSIEISSAKNKKYRCMQKLRAFALNKSEH